jgi:hypothetical protein
VPLDSEAAQILDQNARRLPAALHADQASCAAAHRLDAKGTGAGEKIEHGDAGDAVATLEPAEQRLAHAVGGRPRAHARHRDQSSPAVSSCNDSHDGLEPLVVYPIDRRSAKAKSVVSM